MDLFKQGMKGPTRAAPAVPKLAVNRYSPVTNWNDDPFGADVFEPMPTCTQKKKPPPRPPPPRVNKQPDVPVKPSHFMRKPTVLTSLLARKSKPATNESVAINQMILQHSMINHSSEVDSYRLFPKCEPKNMQTGALIDLSSPPSSPTFTTRSSSDGLSVDSFGSDATTSTSHQHIQNGNTSQAESGFEDDFDTFVTTRKLSKDDILDNFTSGDPFSLAPTAKPAIRKKPVYTRDFYDVQSSVSQLSVPQLKGPTIIRAKPARPKPPDNSALLKSTFGNSFPVTSMNVNTTTPIQKITNGFGDNYDTPPTWDDESPQLSSSSSRESSPPMPCVPPPPPPVVDDELPEPQVDWDNLPADLDPLDPSDVEVNEPHAIALFDYFTDHPDDLSFSIDSRIKLIRRIDAEWLFGSTGSGAQGVFPANYVEIKVPLPNDKLTPVVPSATALYDFEPDQTGDLPFRTGDKIKVLNKINEEWSYGECKGVRGQFPINYVQMS